MATPAELLAVDFPSLLIVPDWIEAHCVIRGDDGSFGPFVMYDWQLACTVHHYRVKPKARVGQFAPAFHYRRSQVIAPQKTGKGPWAATIVCAEAVGPVLFAGFAVGGEVYRCEDHGCGCGWEYGYTAGEPMGRPWGSAYIQLLATAEDQVRNVYRPLQSMVRNGPLGDQMRVGEGFIRLPNEGIVEVVTSSAQARLGNPITFCVQDETQNYTATNGMIEVAETMRRGVAGMKGRSLETTNAYNRSVTSTASKTRNSKRTDIFKFYDEPPTELNYSVLEDRHEIHAYNYSGCEHIDVDSIDAEAAELVETDPAQAERFYGNRIRAGFDAAFDTAQWARLHRPDYMPAKGALITIGVDGARYSDAIAVVGTEVATGFQWPINITERPDGAGDDYEHDFVSVDADMVEAFRQWAVFSIFIDPQYIDHLVDLWAGRWGSKVKSWTTNRPKPAAYMVRSYTQAMTSGEVSHNGDEIFARHIANSRRRYVNVFDDEHRQMYVIAKESAGSSLKIDTAMAGALSFEARGDAIALGALNRSARQSVAL